MKTRNTILSLVIALSGSLVSSLPAQDQGGRLLDLILRGVADAVLSQNSSPLVQNQYAPSVRHPQTGTVSPRVVNPRYVPPRTTVVPSPRPPVRITPSIDLHNRLTERFSQNTDLQPQILTGPHTNRPNRTSPSIDLHNRLPERFSQNTDLQPQILTGPYYDPPIRSPRISPYRGQAVPRTQHSSRHQSHPRQEMKLKPILPPLFQGLQYQGHSHGSHSHGTTSRSSVRKPEPPKVIGVNTPFGQIFRDANGNIRQGNRVMLYRVC